MTVAQTKKFINKYGPAIRKLYGSEAMQALGDLGRTAEMLARNKYVSYGKGSTTTEKLSMGLKVAENISAIAAVVHGVGWVFSASKNLAKSAIEPAVRSSRQAVEDLVIRGLTDPEFAKELMKIARTKHPETIPDLVTRRLRPFIVGGVSLATQPTPPQEEPNASQSTP